MRGLTQAELAERVGTKQSSIARLESGKSEPRLSFLRRVVEAMGGRLKTQILSEDSAMEVEKNKRMTNIFEEYHKVLRKYVIGELYNYLGAGMEEASHEKPIPVYNWPVGLPQAKIDVKAENVLSLPPIEEKFE
jgi:transcriptional regulator with XRE-family HTH domain